MTTRKRYKPWPPQTINVDQRAIEQLIDISVPDNLSIGAITYVTLNRAREMEESARRRGVKEGIKIGRDSPSFGWYIVGAIAGGVFYMAYVVL